MPGISAPSSTGELFVREKDTSLRCARRCCFQRRRVRGVDLVVVVNVLTDCSFNKRSEHIRQQQVGNSAKLITGGRMPRDLNAEGPKLLNETPDLRAARADLIGDLGTADYNRRVVGQQPNDAAKARVGFLSGRSVNCSANASWRRFDDAGIIAS